MKKAVIRAVAAMWLVAGCGESDEGSPIAVAGGGGGGGGGPREELLSDAVFREEELNDFHLTMDPADWDSILMDTRGDVYRHTSFRWKDVAIADVAVRPSGSATRFPGNPKMSLKLKFNEFVPGQKFMGLKTLKLDGLYERTMQRENLCYHVFRQRNPATPRAVYCKLFVNGEYRGVYMAEERVTSDLVRHRFPTETGNLYRLRVADPEAFTYAGADPQLYLPDPWQPITHELTGDHTVIPRFLDVLNHRPAELATVCDVENLVTHLALEAAVISRDGILRNAGPPHNCFEYRRPDTGLFMLIPWDLDQTWTSSEATRDIFFNFGNTKIAVVVRDTPELNALYRQKLADIVTNVTSPDRIAARLDLVHARIRDAVYADPNKRTTNADFDGYRDSLKETARMRYENLRSQLGLGP